MRVCILNSTGEILEAQPGNDSTKLQTLWRNAYAIGLSPSDITITVISDQDYADRLAAYQTTHPVIPTISRRQFYQYLAVLEVITEDEALASNAGVIPSSLLALIEAMPAESQFAAKMLVTGANIFERNHPVTIAIGSAYGWTNSQVDQFFIEAAKL